MSYSFASFILATVAVVPVAAEDLDLNKNCENHIPGSWCNKGSCHGFYCGNQTIPCDFKETDANKCKEAIPGMNGVADNCKNWIYGSYCQDGKYCHGLDQCGAQVLCTGPTAQQQGKCIDPSVPPAGPTENERKATAYCIQQTGLADSYCQMSGQCHLEEGKGTPIPCNPQGPNPSTSTPPEQEHQSIADIADIAEGAFSGEVPSNVTEVLTVIKAMPSLINQLISAINQVYENIIMIQKIFCSLKVFFYCLWFLPSGVLRIRSCILAVLQSTKAQSMMRKLSMILNSIRKAMVRIILFTNLNRI